MSWVCVIVERELYILNIILMQVVCNSRGFYILILYSFSIRLLMFFFLS